MGYIILLEVGCLRLVVFNLSNHADPYFLACLIVTNFSEKRSFSRFKRIKNEFKGLQYSSIGCLH